MHETFLDKQFNEYYGQYFQVNSNYLTSYRVNHVLNCDGYRLPIYTNLVLSNWVNSIVQVGKFYDEVIDQNRTVVFVSNGCLDLFSEVVAVDA